MYTYSVINYSIRKQFQGKMANSISLPLNTNDYDRDFNQSITACFESQVSRHPENIAIKTGDDMLTYFQLNQFANRIARDIVFRINKNQKTIALFMNKNNALFAAMLGILKSGNIYIPLAPSDPPARIKHILEDSEAKLLITDSALFNKARTFVNKRVKVINIDQLSENGDGSQLRRSVEPGDIANIIYTSGSTGKPKGVTQTHRNIQHLVNNYARFIKVTPQDRMTLFAPFSHSAGVMDIYGALLYGATLLPYDIYSNSIAYIKDWLVKEKITIYHSVPTLYRTIIDMLDGSEQFPDLRVLDLGGETVYLKDVDAYKKHFSDDCIFTNGFGSTELTVLFQFKADKNYTSQEAVFPIGNPVSGVDYLLLDDNGKEVEGKSIGELVYTSPALTPGYWKLPELNKAIFRTLPSHEGKRWIFSGDLVTRNQDGTLTFVERKDFQVKVRGFRVELAEIEHALEKHPKIKQAIVVDRSKQSSSSSLMAFFVPRAQNDPSNMELREHLREFLPEYMLPENFSSIPSFPYTASGKVDRKALIALEVPKTPQTPQGRDPLPGLEEKLVSIWMRVLGREQVYVNSNFFDLGGNSLTALRLAYQVRKDLDVELPLDAIFQVPTIELQAKLLGEEGQEKIWKTLVPVKSIGTKTPFFCVSPTVIDVITYRDLADQLDHEQPLYALYSQTGGAFREINETIEEEINKFVDEIRQVQKKGPYLIGGYSAGGRAALHIANRLEAEGELVRCVILLDTFGPGYPERLPWISVRLFNLLKILRRVQSYLWKFWILDFSGKRDLLLSRERPLVSRVSNWIENRSGEYKKAQNRTSSSSCLEKSLPFHETNAEVVLLRAKRGLLGVKRDHSLGWRKLFDDKLHVQEVPGDHEAILFGPRIRKVAQVIQGYLDKAMENH